MNTLESILCYGGAAAFLFSFVLMEIVDRLKKNAVFAVFAYFAIIVLFFGGLTCLFVGVSMYTDTLDCEKVDIIITIQDKQEHTRLVGKRVKHQYFFYFNDTEEIEVDASTYRKFNKGDTLVIKKTYYYRTDRETDERTLEKVTYNE